MTSSSNTSQDSRGLLGAVEAFNSTLTAEHQLYFLPTEFSQLQESVKHITVIANGKIQDSKVFNLLTKLNHALDPYFKVVGIFVSAKPEIAAFVWGAIRLILQVSLPCLLENINESLTKGDLAGIQLQHIFRKAHLAPWTTCCVLQPIRGNPQTLCHHWPSEAFKNPQNTWEDIQRCIWNISKLYADLCQTWWKYAIVIRNTLVVIIWHHSFRTQEGRHHHRTFVVEVFSHPLSRPTIEPVGSSQGVYRGTCCESNVLFDEWCSS